MEVLLGPLLSSFDFGIFRVFGAIFKFVIEYWKVFAVILIILSFKYGFFQVFGIAFFTVLLYLSIVFWAAIIYTAYDTFQWIFGEFGLWAIPIGIFLFFLYSIFKGVDVGEGLFAWVIFRMFRK